MWAPVLRFPVFLKPFTLTTNLSKYRIGEDLSHHFDGEEHPVAYASRHLNGAEQKYGATEQECATGGAPFFAATFMGGISRS